MNFNDLIKKLLIILLFSILFIGCVSNSFDKNEYIGNDYKPVEYFINLRLISFGDNYRIYTDTLTGVLYYSVKQNGKWSSPIVIIEEDNTALTYNEAMNR